MASCDTLACFQGGLTKSPIWLTRSARGGRHWSFSYTAGRCGYGLHWKLTGLDHDCIAVAPWLIRMKAGDRVQQRYAVMLAKLHRVGELTSVGVPEKLHEAIRKLVRTRAICLGA